jgi:drug/metabolite transporter (DMT)-like permease
MDNILRGILLLVWSGVVFTFADSLAKAATLTLPVLQVARGRYIFHFVFLPAFGDRPFAGASWSIYGWARMLRTRHLGLQLTRSVLLLVVTLSYFGAIHYVPLADAAAVAFLEPLLIMALAHVFLKEHVGPRRWIAVAIGLAGVIVVIRPGFGMIHWGILLAVLTAICAAVYVILTRVCAQYDSAATSLAYSSLAGVIGLSLAMPFVWQPADYMHWLMFLGLGMAGGYGHFLVIKAFAKSPGSTLAPFLYVQMLWTVAAGWFWFGDWPIWSTWAGIGLIVGSGLYSLHRERIRARQQAQDPRRSSAN